MAHSIGDVVMGSWTVIATPPTTQSNDPNRYLIRHMATGEIMDWIDNPLDAGYVPPAAPSSGTASSMKNLTFKNDPNTTVVDNGDGTSTYTLTKVGALADQTVTGKAGTIIHLRGWFKMSATNNNVGFLVGFGTTHYLLYIAGGASGTLEVYRLTTTSPYVGTPTYFFNVLAGNTITVSDGDFHCCELYLAILATNNVHFYARGDDTFGQGAPARDTSGNHDFVTGNPTLQLGLYSAVTAGNAGAAVIGGGLQYEVTNTFQIFPN